jgi:hypothetical protein
VVLPVKVNVVSNKLAVAEEVPPKLSTLDSVPGRTPVAAKLDGVADGADVVVVSDEVESPIKGV